MFNNKTQRRKVSDSSAESNANKFIGSPDDVLTNRTDSGLNRSIYSAASTSSEQTPNGPPKLSHRPQPSSSQEVNNNFKLLLNVIKLTGDLIINIGFS